MWLFNYGQVWKYIIHARYTIPLQQRNFIIKLTFIVINNTIDTMLHKNQSPFFYSHTLLYMCYIMVLAVAKYDIFFRSLCDISRDIFSELHSKMSLKVKYIWKCFLWHKICYFQHSFFSGFLPQSDAVKVRKSYAHWFHFFSLMMMLLP